MTGLIYVFTGEGKGKTSAALGVATRAALIGKKVVWISFYKGKDWDLAEKHLPEKLPALEMHFTGKGFFIGKKTAPVGNKGNVVVDTATEGQHKEAAEEGLRLTVNKLKSKPFLLVMDEILNAVSEGLVEEQALLEILGTRGESHVVMTGRGLTEAVKSEADLATECRKIKHPYDIGTLAVRGLDF